MKVLFIGMSNSVHTMRWTNQIAGLGWDLHLFPVDSNVRFHTGMRDITVHDQIHSRLPEVHESVRTVDALGSILDNGWPIRRFRRHALRLTGKYHNQWNQRDWRLAQVIRKLQPDIIHSLEIQGAGYLTLAARERYGRDFPTWVVTCWGNDIYLFGRLAEHKDRIQQVVSNCDYFVADCQRDVDLAYDFGFNGTAWPVFPTGGGYDIEGAQSLMAPGPVSSRRMIMIKGYQGNFGRSLVALRAIQHCADALRGYRIGIYLAGEDVRIAAELTSRETGIPIDIIPHVSHQRMLELRGRARISIGLNISDGTPNSMLEALLMGAFPIQSYMSGANEWIEHGVTGMLVHPEEPEEVARAIRQAVADDELVDRAAEINWRTARERLDAGTIRSRIIETYRNVYAGWKSNTHVENSETVIQTQIRQ